MSTDAPPAEVTPKAAADRQTRTPREEGSEWWVAPVGWVALAVFVAIPLLAPFAQVYAGRVVWTMLVASLPLFIVLVGYHRWRRICPLAFFAQLPARLGRGGRRKVSARGEANYYYVVASVFFVSLWLRLVATNGDGPALSAFFVLLTLAALACGLLFTGKTWCNYVCPVSFVEKIYTEPQGLRETPNSQCSKCTACKKFCPDISEENGYWKELGSNPKRVVYYAFPGLVFGFYFYYYLQAGSWSYYFGGAWTDEPGVIWRAFLPGRDAATAGSFFLTRVPRALASLLTLAACGAASLALFGAVERVAGRRLRGRGAGNFEARARHITFALAAFAAFVTFYTFAGAPTLWKLPWAVPHLFLVVVVLTATASLLRRLRRTPELFAEESLARNIVKRWEWADLKAPEDLHDAFLVHTVRTQEGAKTAAQVLEVYREGVREALAEGFVSREDVQRLERLRAQLRIKKADHDKVMAALAEDARARLADPARQVSAEKRLQLMTYRDALERHLARGLDAGDEAAGGSFLRRLRAEYRVTKEEHDAVLDQLLGGEAELAARLGVELGVLERAAHAVRALEESPSPAHDFLAHLLRERRSRAVERLTGCVGLADDDARAAEVRRMLCSHDAGERRAGLERLRAAAPPAAAARLAEPAGADDARRPLAELLRAYTASADPYVRATALYVLAAEGGADEDLIRRLAADEHEVVRETAADLLRDAGLTTVEKMILLRSVGLFSALAPAELAELAEVCSPADYAPGAVLCREGELGHEVFVVVAGEVKVLRGGPAGESVVAVEGAGSLLGEMAVIEPAPRAATVLAGDAGARALRLDGRAFREALASDPSIATGVLRTLVRRLRKK